jgi:hypothetical protein
MFFYTIVEFFTCRSSMFEVVISNFVFVVSSNYYTSAAAKLNRDSSLIIAITPRKRYISNHWAQFLEQLVISGSYYLRM